MKKITILVIISFLVLFMGCTKATSTKAVKQNGKSSAASVKSNSKNAEITTPAPTITPSDTIDYKKYIKRTWIEKNGSNDNSFCIYEIKNGEITGDFISSGIFNAIPDEFANVNSNLTGTINKDKAECKFRDGIGNEGAISLIFKQNNEIEATIKLTVKSQKTDEQSQKGDSNIVESPKAAEQPQEGDFEFVPYNISNLSNFKVIEDESYMVDLNSFGNVKFLSGRRHYDGEDWAQFYLTNEDGDILYEFGLVSTLSRSLKVASFEDVNNDGLKDAIIIVADPEGHEGAVVYFQEPNGCFTVDSCVNDQIRDNVKDKSLDKIKDYISKM